MNIGTIEKIYSPDFKLRLDSTVIPFHLLQLFPLKIAPWLFSAGKTFASDSLLTALSRRNLKSGEYRRGLEGLQKRLYTKKKANE